MTPFGVSAIYWLPAFASDNTTNSTESVLPSNSTQLVVESSVEPTTSLCEPVINSTEYRCSEQLSFTYEISIIHYSTTLNSFEHLSINDEISITLNSTNPTSATAVTKDSETTPTESWEFEDESGIEFSGNATVSNAIQNTTSLVLDGTHDYGTIDGNSTNHVSEMTISTWVKPDYSSGSQNLPYLAKNKHLHFL